MRVDEIYDLVSSRTQGGTLQLPSSALGAQAQRAIDTFFEGKSLSLGMVTVTKEQNRVVARGVSTQRPFDTLQVTAAFFDSGGSLAAELAGTLPGSWSPARGFPGLESTFLGKVVASEGVLTLATPAAATPATITGALTAGYRRDNRTVDLGRGFFRASGGTGATGYLAGFAAPASFTPAAIWEPLAPLFSILEFSDSGVIYSTIEAKSSDFGQLSRTSVPATIKPGVTFFTSLRLGGALEPLSLLFGSSARLNLSGLIDLANPVQSVVKAQIPGAIDLVALRFDDLMLNLRPGASAFDLQADAKLSFGGGANISLKGAGTIDIAKKSARMQIIVAEWKNALGIPHFTISDFGLGIGVKPGAITADFMGHFSVGAGGKFGFVLGGGLVNFAKPVALTFKLDKRDPADPLKLSQIIESFTSLDLSSVPIFKDIAFRELEFHAISDPSGSWTAPVTKAGEPPVTFKNGIGLRADLRFFNWDLEGAIEVGESGIKAAGKIVQGIDLLGVLRIHAYGNRNIGPSFKIDTTKLRPKLAGAAGGAGAQTLRLLAADDAYFAFDGAIDLLGLSQQFRGAARDDGFEVDFTSSLAGLFTTEFHAKYKKGESLAGSASGGFDLRLSLPALQIAGVTILPAVTINGPVASLSIGVAVSKTEAKLDLRLKFSWLGVSFDIGFTLDAMKIANLLSNLWDEIKKWIVANLATFYDAILGTAQKFVDAIKSGALWVADQAVEIANVLKNYYNCAAAEVSKFLTDVGCTVEAVIKAVGDAFKVAYEEAAKIVNDAVKTCGVGMAGGMINQ